MSERLFHYTTSHGLLGILQEQAIWATNIHYLNDAAEFTYATRIANDCLRDRISCSPALEEVSLLQGFQERLHNLTDTNIFVVSLSEEADLLSQWRGYCSGGTGFSIGIDKTDLTELARYQAFQLEQCIYDFKEQFSLISQLIQSSLDTWHKRMQEEANASLVTDQTLQGFPYDFLQLAPRLKHPGYREEKEWRLISPNQSDISSHMRFRERKGTLAPFRTFRLTDLDGVMRLQQINIGPNPEMELAANTLRRLINSSKVEGVAVSQSSIPYRGY